MANPLKQLAGETAIYGLSTILARIINFFFVPFYTRLLTPESYGVVTEFMAYIAVLQVVLVLGLETGCFRFANKEGVDPAKVYANGFITTFAVSFGFLALMVAFAGPIANALGYAGHEACVKYLGGILAFDCTTAILFAKLRQEHKALKFAILKTIKILTETGANLFLFFWHPAHPDTFLSAFVSPTPDFSYVIFAIFISSAVCGVLFIPDLLKMSYRMDGALLRKMLLYSLPLMAAALPGIINDFLDRILFRYLDTGSEAWRSSLGIFQAAVKLSVIMSLFIQMFRFAAEPFFFQRAEDRNSKELYAAVLEFFTAFCGLIFLGVILYIDILSLILGRDFRSGLAVVPIMLASYILLGINNNVSMWYKLSEKTGLAIWITLAGMMVTIVINVAFMPTFSYMAAAWGHLCSYLVMLVISAWLGSKYYPIPYRWGKILLILAAMCGIWLLGIGLDSVLFGNMAGEALLSAKSIARFALHTILIICYIAIMAVLLRKRYREIVR